MQYWLIKSESATYSIDDLKRDKTIAWEGVRNFQARNNMQQMKKGDLVLFYHSSSTAIGVAGIARVVATAHPDQSQFKPGELFEPRATKDSPIWHCVDIAFGRQFRHIVPLDDIKKDSALSDMVVRSRGSRLSVQPVSERHFKYVRDFLGTRETKA